jgi:CheY-like chemotaxis protein
MSFMTPAGAATRHAASDGEAGPAANAKPLSGRPDERLLGKRILIIEDEALLAFELQLVFEDEGAMVIGPAMSLLQALELVAHTAEIDAALLDVDLAGDDVYPIAELLLQRGVPFAFHTGHGSHTALTQLFPGMATLMKPMLPESLVEHLAGIAR